MDKEKLKLKLLEELTICEKYIQILHNLAENAYTAEGERRFWEWEKRGRTLSINLARAMCRLAGPQAQITPAMWKKWRWFLVERIEAQEKLCQICKINFS